MTEYINNCEIEPICQCYSKMAVVSSLLNSSENSKNWFLINYFDLLLTGIDEDNWIWLDLCGDFCHGLSQEWECCPYIKCDSIDFKEYAVEEIVQEILTRLREGKIIYCNIDQYYIRYNYGHYLHDTLIVGLSNDKFVCRDYFDGFYNEKLINIQQLISAFKGKRELSKVDRLPYTYIMDAQEGENFNLFNNAYRVIESYLLGSEFEFRDTTSIPRIFKAYGINVYPEMVKKLDLIFNKNDIKLFYALKDHFIIESKLIKLLFNNFDKECDFLNYNMEVLCSSALKMKISKKYNKKRIIDILKLIEEKERQLLRTISFNN